MVIIPFTYVKRFKCNIQIITIHMFILIGAANNFPTKSMHNLKTPTVLFLQKPYSLNSNHGVGYMCI